MRFTFAASGVTFMQDVIARVIINAVNFFIEIFLEFTGLLWDNSTTSQLFEKRKLAK